MTEFMGLSKNLISEKWRLMNWIVIVDLIFLVVLDLLRIFTGGWDGEIFPSYFFATFAFSISMANFIGFVLLSRNNERAFTSNNYRLIPTSDTKLYFSNLLTTFAAFIYLQILEVVVGTIIYFISGQSDFNLMSGTGQTNGVGGTFCLIMLFMILAMLLVWTGITSVHFIINWISGFLPFARQKFVSFILYVVVTIAGLTIFNYTTGNIFSMIYKSSQGIASLSAVNNVIWLGIGITAIWFVLFTALNIYLLKRWTETVR